jgi:hypothetical protein
VEVSVSIISSSLRITGLALEESRVVFTWRIVSALILRVLVWHVKECKNMARQPTAPARSLP